MRDYGKVFCGIWSSSNFRQLDEDGRALVLYLLTCPHATIAGVFRLPDGYITDDLQWPRERVSKGFTNVEDMGFATRCPVTHWVWINKYLKWNQPENPNQWKAVNKVIDQIPKDCLWLDDFRREVLGTKSEPEANPSGTVSKPVTVTGTVVVTGSGDPTAAAPPADDWFLEFKATYPKRAGDQGWQKARRAASARIAEGHTPAEMVHGASRYLQYCQATEAVGSVYVKQAATFLGPDKFFLQPWTQPPSKADIRLSKNISAAEEFMRRTETQ